MYTLVSNVVTLKNLHGLNITFSENLSPTHKCKRMDKNIYYKKYETLVEYKHEKCPVILKELYI